MSEHYVLNPTTLIENKSHLETSNNLILKINEITCRENHHSTFNNCPHDVRGSGLFSKLLICCFIKHFALDRSLTNLNIREMSKTIDELCPQSINKESNKKEISKSETSKINKKDRIMKANKLLIDIESMNPDHILEILKEQCTTNNEPQKANKPFLGKTKYGQNTDKFKLRSDFNKNMKKTVLSILSNADITNAKPTIEVIQNHFHHDEPNAYKWNLNEVFVKRSLYPLTLDQMSPCEVLNELKKSDNTAPGLDNITYKNIKYLDPEGILLCHLYNKIISTATIPTAWKSFKTILIPKPDKKNLYSEISSWRPIALLSVIYKIFAAILTRRLNFWIKENNLLHQFQKAGSEHEGCVEHNSILTAAIEYSKYNKSSPIAIAWLDIKDAFGSVPHQYMWSLLRCIGIDEAFINIVKSLYTETSSIYSCGNILTECIPIKKGVKQGCPLSMTLFAIAINPMLEAIKYTPNVPRFMIGDSAIQVLAYADDISLIANNVEDLQKLINQASFIAMKIGLEFRPNKCAYLQLPRINIKDEISIYKTKIKKLETNEFYQYLGVPIGETTDQTPYEILSNVVSDAEKLANSDLLGWQKLKSYKIFLHSRLIFAFRTREIKTKSLNTSNSNPHYNFNITSQLRIQFRQMMNLPNNSEITYFYCSTEDGGANCVDLLDEYHTQSVVHLFRLLTTNCTETEKINREHLCFVTNSDCLNLQSAFDLINNKSNSNKSNSRKSQWIRSRNALHYFNKIHNIKITFEVVNKDVALRITTLSKGTFILTRKFRGEIAFILHRELQESYAIKWHNSKKSNLIADAIKLTPDVNKSIFRGDIGIFAWNFIHKARNNLLSINARPQNTKPEQRLCRRCHDSEETMAHVLQSCRVTKSLTTKRHNACLDKLITFLKSPSRIIVKDHTCLLVPDSKERVDLIITNDEAKSIHLIDIKCPIDSTVNYAEVDKKNIEKYTKLKDKIKLVKSDYKVDLHTFIVGSLGSIPKSTYLALSAIGLSSDKIQSCLKQCGLSNIDYSAKIWRFHTTGNLEEEF